MLIELTCFESGISSAVRENGIRGETLISRIKMAARGELQFSNDF